MYPVLGPEAQAACLLRSAVLSSPSGRTAWRPFFHLPAARLLGVRIVTEPFTTILTFLHIMRPTRSLAVGRGSASYYLLVGEVESYRAFRHPWRGTLADRPAVVSVEGPEDRVTLYASWNGATEVEGWDVLAGPEPGGLESLGSAPKRGFETEISFTTDELYVAVKAMDRSGRDLPNHPAAALKRTAGFHPSRGPAPRPRRPRYGARGSCRAPSRAP